MGLSFPNIPNANFTNTIKLHYKTINELCKKNTEYKKLNIDYTKLDGNTVNELRKEIAEVVHRFDYPSVISPIIREEMKRIFTLNMSSMVEINYEKLCDGEEDYSIILRNNIQKVLEDRKIKVYNNMILNPTI